MQKANHFKPLLFHHNIEHSFSFDSNFSHHPRIFETDAPIRVPQQPDFPLSRQSLFGRNKNDKRQIESWEQLMALIRPTHISDDDYFYELATCNDRFSS